MPPVVATFTMPQCRLLAFSVLQYLVDNFLY